MDSSSGSGSTALRRQSTSTTATTMTTRRRRGTTALKMHTRGMFATAVVCLLALVVVVAPVLVKAAPYEPPGNQVLFGVWIDPADGYNDRPIDLNNRVGQRVPVYQLAQVIPMEPFNYVTGAGGAAPENIIEESRSDAAVFLTVYPNQGFAAVTNADLTELGQQILDYQTTLNRTVFLRWAPEFQGLWNEYGLQPLAFIEMWTTMYRTIKSIAPETIMVWAPNTPQGYPYGYTSARVTSAAELQALDTNNNGELDADDDAFSPWWPGDDYVDWVGLSLYYKGTDQFQVLNNIQPDGYCAQAINGVNPSNGATISNWYQDYCAAKPNVACMLAESGAAYHVNDSDSTVSRSDLQQAWVTGCITNDTLLDEFPRLKLFMHFEYEKFEQDNADQPADFRDFRVTNDTEVVSLLRGDFASLGDRFSWANSRAPPSSISSAGAPAATGPGGSTIVQAITATTRARPTSFPSLFGITSDGTQLAEFVELGIMVVAGVGGALAVMRSL